MRDHARIYLALKCFALFFFILEKLRSRGHLLLILRTTTGTTMVFCVTVTAKESLANNLSTCIHR